MVNCPHFPFALAPLIKDLYLTINTELKYHPIVSEWYNQAISIIFYFEESMTCEQSVHCM